MDTVLHVAEALTTINTADPTSSACFDLALNLLPLMTTELWSIVDVSVPATRVVTTQLEALAPVHSNDEPTTDMTELLKDEPPSRVMTDNHEGETPGRKLKDESAQTIVSDELPLL